MKSIDIKGKQYIEVNERLKHFREKYTDWALESEIVSLDNGVCVIKATVKNPDGVVKATGYAYEKENSTFINKTSYIENCETSAWGRALGNLGIGIDTSIASAEEVLNAQLNQPKEMPKPKAETKPKQEAKKEVNEFDVAFYEEVKSIETVEELKEYYEQTKGQVKDVKAYNVVVGKRKAELMKG